MTTSCSSFSQLNLILFKQILFKLNLTPNLNNTHLPQDLSPPLQTVASCSCRQHGLPTQPMEYHIIPCTAAPKSSSETEEDITESDTIHLHKTIDEHGVLKACSSIKGPYALVYFDKCKKELWFGRDYWGRRSLLLQYNDEQLTLSSVRPDSGQYIEVPAVGVFCFSLETEQLKCHLYNNIDVSRIEAMSEMFKDVNCNEDFLTASIPSQHQSGQSGPQI